MGTLVFRLKSFRQYWVQYVSTMYYGHTNYYFVLLNRSRVLRIRKVILPNSNSENPVGLTFRMSRIQPLFPTTLIQPPSFLPDLLQLLPLCSLFQPQQPHWPFWNISHITSTQNLQWLIALWVKAQVPVTGTKAYSIWSPITSLG